MEPQLMRAYRKGAVLGLTVAETFILLTFLLLLVALLSLIPPEDSAANPDTPSPPQEWVPPEKVKALISSEKQARKAAELERDQALSDLSLLRRKGDNPPCWYQTVPDGEGKTREKRDYVFNVAIYQDGIELASRKPPPGGAYDNGGGEYANEWEHLRVGDLPYGKRLSDDEFIEAVSDLVEKGKNRQVRTYECVFSVKVWDMIPEHADHAKERWQHAHDVLVEGRFNAYRVRSGEWKGAN